MKSCFDLTKNQKHGLFRDYRKDNEGSLAILVVEGVLPVYNLLGHNPSNYNV